MPDRPRILEFSKIGDPALGYITVGESKKNIPFDIKRVYWTYFTPQDVVRGGHAHYDLEQVIVAVSGLIIFNTENKLGIKERFVLNSPNQGLYMPQMIWRDIQFSHSAVLLCLASEMYDEADYIREYNQFQQAKNI